jgi:hypothetical protein
MGWGHEEVETGVVRRGVTDVELQRLRYILGTTQPLRPPQARHRVLRVVAANKLQGVGVG